MHRTLDVVTTDKPAISCPLFGSQGVLREVNAIYQRSPISIRNITDMYTRENTVQNNMCRY
jgi:hypothetical protein